MCGWGAGAGKISQIHSGAERGGFKFCGCGAGADKNLNPRRALVQGERVRLKDNIGRIRFFPRHDISKWFSYASN